MVHVIKLNSLTKELSKWVHGWKSLGDTSEGKQTLVVEMVLE